MLLHWATNATLGVAFYPSFFNKLLWCAPPWTFELSKRHWWTRYQCHCHPKLWRSPQSLLINQGSKCNIHRSVVSTTCWWCSSISSQLLYIHTIRVKRNFRFHNYCVWGVCNAALSHSRPILHLAFRFVPCLWFTCLNSAQLVLSIRVCHRYWNKIHGHLVGVSDMFFLVWSEEPGVTHERKDFKIESPLWHQQNNTNFWKHTASVDVDCSEYYL
jgi:hypothetical protein